MITPEELETNQTKLEAIRTRVEKQKDISNFYENGHIEVGGTVFAFPVGFTNTIKAAFIELRGEVIELENAITG